MMHNNSMQPYDPQAGMPDAPAAGRRGRSRHWPALSVLLAIVVVCTGGLAWWRPWETEEVTQPAPATVCNGVYETAELDRILNSQIGDYWGLHIGPQLVNCTVQSGKPPATDAKGYERDDTVVYIDFPSSYKEYHAGNGVKWSPESMAAAADTGSGVHTLDTPDLEGSSYLWVRHMDADTYVYGFWYGNEQLVVVKLRDIANRLDGPQTVEEASDVMPELLTYVVTEAQKHNALPTHAPRTPTPDATNQPTAVSTEP